MLGAYNTKGSKLKEKAFTFLILCRKSTAAAALRTVASGSGKKQK